jgi:hypothetical protein
MIDKQNQVVVESLKNARAKDDRNTNEREEQEKASKFGEVLFSSSCRGAQQVIKSKNAFPEEKQREPVR